MAEPEPMVSELRAAGVVLAAGRTPVSEVVRAGEIVGLSGLDGHGQERFLEILAGLQPARGGEVAVSAGGAGTRVEGFRQAVRHGIAYLPRDRRATGIFPTLSILDNFAIATIGRDVRGGLISRRARSERYRKFHERLSIVAPNGNAPITSLSGGNQQKVLFARALATTASLVLMDDPMRGVDVGTKQEVYSILRSEAAEGRTFLWYSTEMDEIRLCDRVYVFRDGAIVAELTGDNVTEENVLAASFTGEAA